MAESIYGKHKEVLPAVLKHLVSQIENYNETKRKETGEPAYEHLIYRIKSEDSMREKCQRKGLPPVPKSALYDIHDAIGIRIVCCFLNDIYDNIKFIESIPGAKVIVGKDDVVEKVWISILAQGHVLLEDVPGVGKTTMALAFSKALGLETKRVQFTPDTMPSDIIGFSLPEQGRMVYQPGAVMTNLLLADEINRTSSKTQSALLEAMEEGHVTVDGVTHDLPAPFVVLATQNPIGSAGTQNLPNSQLDRFLMKLSMGYPDVGSQVRILKERSQQEPLEQVEPVMRREELIAAIARVRQVHVDDQIYDYIARLAEVTRTHPLLKLGISPRGALALCRTAKARAFAEGRDFVVPEDVTQMAEYVFAHRLMLSSKARLNEYTPEAIVAEVLAQTQPPVLSERRA